MWLRSQERNTIRDRKEIDMNKIVTDESTFTHETEEYIFLVNNKLGDGTYTDKKTGSVTEFQCGKGEPAKN
jgi:hypothetical protein